MTVRAVLENTDAFIAEGLALARSLRAFGGPHADARCELHFVECTPHDTTQFDALGVTLTTVPRFDRRSPQSNKLGMFHPVETDYLLAVDADVLVVGDVTPYLIGTAIAAVPANAAKVLSHARWQEVFADAGVSFPSDRLLAPFSWQETIPYFNSGVLVVPGTRVASLREEWVRRTHELFEADDARDWWSTPQRAHVNQIALAIAASTGAFPRRALPIEMNYMLIDDELPAAHDGEHRVPLLLHVFHRIDFASGRVVGSATAVPGHHRPVREAIERYNALLEIGGV